MVLVNLSPDNYFALKFIFFNFCLIIYNSILAFITALMMPQLTKKYSLVEFEVGTDRYSKEFFEKYCKLFVKYPLRLKQISVKSLGNIETKKIWKISEITSQV